jgi:hypothetical protein
LDPRLCDGHVERLTEVMVAWSRSPWAQGGAPLLERILEHLPAHAALPADLPDRARRRLAKAAVYTAFGERNAQAIPRLWLRVAREDRDWLRNRGNWSILIRSLGWLALAAVREPAAGFSGRATAAANKNRA